MRVNIGICQLKVSKNKDDNLKNVEIEIDKLCSSQNINILVLPECWNCPYGIEYFDTYSEEIECSKSIELLKSLAKKYGIYLVGGSIPIKENGKIYNTCFCFNPDGCIIGRYDKIHLFNIEIKEYDFEFKESSVLCPGTKPLIIDTIFGRIGIGICFDLRFPLLANYYSKNKCNIIIYPGSFSEKTGPLHWTLLLRARAVDNQCYIVGCSTAKNTDFKYKGYGHSSIINPMGEVIYDVGENQISYSTEIDLRQVEDVRLSIPVLSHDN